MLTAYGACSTSQTTRQRTNGWRAYSLWTQCRKIQVANSSDACCVSGQRRCWGAASWRFLGSQSCDVNGQAEFPPLLHREKSLVSMDRSMVCPQSDYSLTSRYTLVSQSISESLSLALRRAQAYSNHTDILHFFYGCASAAALPTHFTSMV